MRKNQKYCKEQMFQSIEKWQSSGLTQLDFSKREKLSTSTFSYWLKKYKKEKGQAKPYPKNSVKTFIPVEISKTKEPAVLDTGQIQITYPNGIKVICPASIAAYQLKTIISI